MGRLERLAASAVVVAALAWPGGVSAQQEATSYKGQHPFLESRVFGASANVRQQHLETTDTRFPEPFRVLIAGDDHAHGCGYSSYPPDYTYSDCSELDAGFRVEFVAQLRALTGRGVVTVGSQINPSSGEYAADDTRHEGRPGMNIDQVRAAVDWRRLRPDVVVLVLGTSDVLQDDAAEEMVERYALLLADIQNQLPTVRIVISSLLAMGPAVSAERRHNRAQFNAHLPKMVATLRSKQSVEIFFADTAKRLRDLCAPGSGYVAAPGLVPLCTGGEVQPTARGYSAMAASLAEATSEVLELDGSCRGRPRCEGDVVRAWRNHIDGGLRVVAS